MSHQPVVVTGLGSLSALGTGWQSLEAMVLSPSNAFSAVPEPWLAYPGGPDAWVAALPVELNAALSAFESVSTDRSSAMALMVAEQAWHQSGLRLPPKGVSALSDSFGERAGVYWGSGMGGLHTTEQSYHRVLKDNQTLRPMTVIRIMANSAASHLAIKFQLRGPNNTYSVACASSAIALGEAMLAIRSGRIDVALVGGSEAMLVPLVMSAWGALRVLSTRKSQGDPRLASRPFCKDRTGLVIGEGAAALVLESAAHARARGAKALAQISGFGSSCDAASLVHPAAEGQVRAMRLALIDAGLAPKHIGSINAHATGTDAGDVSETKALTEIFAESGNIPPVSATKSIHGHLLGAAGALEAAICVASLQLQCLPATLASNPIDTRCAGLDLPDAPQPTTGLNHIMSNSFAFGGSNASLIFSRINDDAAKTESTTE